MSKVIKYIPIIFALFSIHGYCTSPWGKSYFPNTRLITDTGEQVDFYDDLIKGKIVAINFIYTSCPDTCPLETAHLVKVQKILGDRLGSDIFIYSISIDPENDTVEVLHDYKKRFGANWTFLTGEKAEIGHLRRKLGLYIDEIDNNSRNHSISMIIGNEATGRWMKRSPFENPRVLADQLGHWLNDWKTTGLKQDYAKAPKLRDLSQGEYIFRTRCAACHTMTGETRSDEIGPDLLSVSRRRDTKWLKQWLREPDKMLETGDPIAVAMYNRYNQIAMPNMRLNEQEINDLVDYFDQKYDNALKANKADRVKHKTRVVTVVDAWVREAHPNATVNAGYMSIINTSDHREIITGIKSDSFSQVEVHDMAMNNNMMEMRVLDGLEIPPGEIIHLTPGGKHLMLKHPKTRLAPGDRIQLTLAFKSGKTQGISVQVVNR